jgi:hypothetical protein
MTYPASARLTVRGPLAEWNTTRSPTGREALHHDGCAGQRGVPTQRHLDRGREPPQSIVAALGDEKRRLGEIVLGGDGLHHVVAWKGIHHDHRSRVSREPTGGEGVELEYRSTHATRARARA